MSYLTTLNDIQYQAVTTHEGPVMVIAGPGSGKTRVLTFRIANLIDEGKAPYNILALTFTNKAAKEMKARIQKNVGDRANYLWAGTFHSLFARILRIEAPHLGFSSNFTIYDTQDAKSVIKEITEAMKLDPKQYPANALLSRISMAKSNLVTPRMYGSNEDYLQQDTMSRRPHTFEIYKKYMEKCKSSDAMDFDDLLLYTFRLFQENPEVLKKYQERFQYVHVDEFQDTNFLQYGIIRKLVKYPGSNENICIVGDDAQSIYSFRGATISNILDFEKDFPSCKTFKLEQNYRSTEHIVQAANQVITYNKRQIKKEIWTDKGDGEKIEVIHAMTDVEEARRVVDKIIESKNRLHFSNKQIAILYRTNAQSRVFEEQLRRANIAYKVYGGLSFYQRKEVKDMLAYMRMTVNPNDNEALKRSINTPKRGIGKTTVSRLIDIANQNNTSIWEAIGVFQENKPNKKLAGYVELIETFQKHAEQYDAFQTTSYIGKKSGIIDGYKMEGTIEAANRLENISSLIDGVKEFIESDEVIEGEEIIWERDLAGYLQNISLLTDLDSDTEDQNHVSLMSVHAAKGLEYPMVFIVGLEENLFPSFMSIKDPQLIDEERRLFYVAITRAEQFLVLSFADNRYQYGQMRTNDPSRFLEEIDKSHFVNESALSGRKAKALAFETKQPKKIPGGISSLYRSKPSQVVTKQVVPDNPSDIHEGQRVLHAKFGEGVVQTIEGSGKNRMAKIRFDEVSAAEKRILLRFAKLQILE